MIVEMESFDFISHLLSAYCMPGVVLDAEHILTNTDSPHEEDHCLRDKGYHTWQSQRRTEAFRTFKPYVL